MRRYSKQELDFLEQHDAPGLQSIIMQSQSRLFNIHSAQKNAFWNARRSDYFRDYWQASVHTLTQARAITKFFQDDVLLIAFIPIGQSK